MTDSVIQFNYSDNNHMTSIYVRANTHKESFIPLLEEMCADIDKSERFHEGRLNWGNMVLEIIYKIATWVDRPDGIKLITKTADKDCNVIYKHTIQPINDLYSDKTIQTSKTLNINSKYPGSKTKLFNGLLFDFAVKIKEDIEQETDTDV